MGIFRKTEHGIAWVPAHDQDWPTPGEHVAEDGVTIVTVPDTTPSLVSRVIKWGE